MIGEQNDIEMSAPKRHVHVFNFTEALENFGVASISKSGPSDPRFRKRRRDEAMSFAL
jgi:hypothetical protein